MEERVFWKGEVENANRERDELVEKTAELQAERDKLAEKAALVDILRAECDNKSQDLATAKAEIERIRGDGNKEIRRLTDSLAAECIALEEEKQARANGDIDWKKTEQAMQETIDSKKKQVEEAATKAAEQLEQLKTQQKAEQEKAKLIDDQLQSLRQLRQGDAQRLARCDWLEGEVARLVRQKDTLETKIREEEIASRSSSASAAAKHAEAVRGVDRERTTREKAEEECAKAKKEAEDFREKLATAIGRTDIAETHASDVASEYIGKLAAQAQVAEIRHQELETKYKSEMERLELKNAETNRKRVTAEEALVAVEGELASMKEDQRRVQAKLANASMEVAEVSGKLSHAESTVANLAEKANELARAQKEINRLTDSDECKAKEIAELKIQRSALQDELTCSYAKTDEAERKFAAADGERRAFQGQVRELREDLQCKQREREAQLMVIHEKDREGKRLRAELEDQTQGLYNEQFRLALAKEPAIDSSELELDRPDTARGGNRRGSRPSLRPILPSGPPCGPGSKGRPPRLKTQPSI